MVHSGGSSTKMTRMAHCAGCLARLGRTVFSSHGNRWLRSTGMYAAAASAAPAATVTMASASTIRRAAPTATSSSPASTAASPAALSTLTVLVLASAPSRIRPSPANSG